MARFQKKYRESMLPFLINDLHFLFSAQRKKDYESLIVLRNTVHKFVNEVSELLPEITQDELAMKKSVRAGPKDSGTQFPVYDSGV